MKYGYFDDKKKEYVINTPYTPLPWINYLGTNEFFSLISNTCGGYSFYKDAKLRRITRYRYNNVPDDFGGRNFYIKEGSDVWSPAFMPAKASLDEYECRHGLGYSKFKGVRNGVQAELLCFVPQDDNVEINVLSIKNVSDVKKHLSVFTCVEWCLWNAVDDSNNFQRNLSTGEVEITNNAIYHKTEYRERRNHYAFFSTNTPYNGFDTDRATFLGRFNGWDTPQVVFDGKCRQSVASGWSPIGCFNHIVELCPGDEKQIIFLIGYAENQVDKKFVEKDVINKEVSLALIEKYATIDSVEREFNKLGEYWKERLSSFSVTTGCEEFDRMSNIWNQYQCMVTFNMSRSASYYESGIGRGMGFRDSCQDLLGCSHIVELNRIRQRILDIAAIQFEDGSTYHQYQPLTKTGNADLGGGFNDDPLWLIAATVSYIKESGDFSILDEQVSFNNKSGSEKSLLEHLDRSINFTINNKGPHGLPLIGRADWNDCLNLNCFSDKDGESFQTCANFESHKAESVFIAAMFVLYGNEYIQLLNRIGHCERAQTLVKEVQLMSDAVIAHGWDGEWFLRAYDAFSNKVGSHLCEEGKIYIEPQGFCVMAGIGGLEYGNKAMDSVWKYLLCDYGAELLNPCYTKYHLELGEVSSYPPGYKENGSVFCHSNPWIIFALAKVKDGNRAFDLYKRICPAYIEHKSDVHYTEPYVYSQMVAGRSAPNYGQAKNSFLTGTASWTMACTEQAILGIYPEYDGVRISPCIPDEMKQVKITRKLRGCEYLITINNNHSGKIQIIADGEEVYGDIVPYSSKKTVNVIVEM